MWYPRPFAIASEILKVTSNSSPIVMIPLVKYTYAKWKAAFPAAPLKRKFLRLLLQGTPICPSSLWSADQVRSLLIHSSLSRTPSRRGFSLLRRLHYHPHVFPTNLFHSSPATGSFKLFKHCLYHSIHITLQINNMTFPLQ